MSRIRTRLTTAVSLFPWFWILGLALLVLRARIYLGYWPRPARPDPKLLPFEFHHAALWIGFLGAMALLPLAVLAHLVNAFFSKKLIVRTDAWTLLTGCLAIGALAFAPHSPWNWVAWFLD